MMKKILPVLFVLVGASSASAQGTIIADRIHMTDGPCEIQTGSGNPEGSINGNVCDVWINTANGVVYVKWTGTGNTGWGVGFNTHARFNGNTETVGYLSADGYVSQLTGWRMTADGALDARDIFTDTLHSKRFITDLEQALAGGQIICKGVGVVGAAFTNPAAGGAATLTVKDLPSAANMAVFQSGDYVGLRAFTRAAGALTIAETFGIVTAYADQAGGLQTWTFTRGSGANAGTMSTSTLVEQDAIVIDYGVSGNGCHETNAIDGTYGVNSPYIQTWTWTTSPIPANRTLRTRIGNLLGITGVSNEYGFIAGTYAATNGTYLRASNSIFELHGIDLSLWSGSTKTFFMDHAGPSFAFGAAVPPSYGVGTGCWMGNDGGTYKFRCGNPAGISWRGTAPR